MLGGIGRGGIGRGSIGRGSIGRGLTPLLNWGHNEAPRTEWERALLPGVRCVVVLNGELREMPRVAPYGARVVLASGVPTTSPSAGRSLLVNAGGLAEAAAETGLATP